MKRSVLFAIAFTSALTVAVWLGTAGAAVRLVPVVTGLSLPIFVTSARDGSGRLFIVEQGGVIKVLQPGASVPTVFLTIPSSKVLSEGIDRGLLGLAFHPQYATNRRFFVNYTRQTDGDTVIAEYLTMATNPNVADPDSERVFLVIDQPFPNNNGGMIEFGPDDFLYIGMGDGGFGFGTGSDPGNNAQNINSLLGKVLRIDVDTPNGPIPYSSPPSNPFFGATPGADEIYALGLRDPRRFSFDRLTGTLYLGDVGQTGAREEIDIITSGGNYGWRIWEGTSCTGNDPGLCNPAGFVFPMVEYVHSGGRCAVTGGYVYRGSRWALPQGSYAYADFCSGEIFLHLNGASNVFHDSFLTVPSLGEDESGELYVVHRFGTIYRPVSQAHVVDVDGDSAADLIWRNAPGDLAAWFLDGTSVSGTGFIGGTIHHWAVAGVADVNGDGRGDIVWRGFADEVAVWMLDGPSVVDHGLLPSLAHPWTIAGLGDFNGDDRADILWRHPSGSLAVWLLDGRNVIGTGALPNPGPGWTVERVADFNGDGRADILWRNVSGVLSVWLLNGFNLIGSGSPGAASLDWTIVGVGDLNGDLKADIVWRHASGTVAAWLLDGTNLVATGILGTAAADWMVAGVGDIDGDGRADIVWRNAAGTVAGWRVNGLSVVGTGIIGSSAYDWHIQ